MSKALSAIAVAVLSFGCDETPQTSEAPPTTSAPAAASSAAPKPSASARATTASVAGPKPTHPCPKGSEGEGTFKSPCEAKGTKRLMEVTWTGKMTDKGPTFRVVNKTKLDILYGHLFAYFYDKAGKQLELPVAGPDGKARARQGCGGNIFAGPMKAGEKAVLTFSCVHAKHVPEGTVVVEAEMQTVGFIGASGKKADTFWRNKDLVPQKRPKGGAK